MSGQPARKFSAITIKKFDAAGYEFAATISELSPRTDYAAVARSLIGWQSEFAGLSLPDDWEGTARNLNKTSDDADAMNDASTGQTSIAFHDGARLTGLFFKGPRPVALAPTHAISLIGADTRRCTHLRVAGALIKPITAKQSVPA